MRHVYYICFVFKLQAYFLFQTHLSCLKELLLKNMLRKTTKQYQCKNSINVAKIISININSTKRFCNIKLTEVFMSR